MSIGVGSPHQYIDTREKLDRLLKTDEDVLFRWLGLRDFQIEQYGYYDPNKIFEIDFLNRGIETFKKYVEIVKSKFHL